MSPKPHFLSMRLSDNAHNLLEALAEASGTTKAAQIEQAIRAYAKQQGVTAAPPPAPPE